MDSDLMCPLLWPILMEHHLSKPYPNKNLCLKSLICWKNSDLIILVSRIICDHFGYVNLEHF
jgi:hypothetical protein